MFKLPAFCTWQLLLVIALQWSTAPLAQPAYPSANFDPQSIEHIHTAADAERLRAELIRMIWHGDGLPMSLPDKVGGTPSLKIDSDNIAEAVILTRQMEFGIESQSYYYQASRFSKCLFIYHSGHNEGVSDALKASLWKRVLDGGCDLLYVAMPLMDQNPRPVVQSKLGPLLLKTHDALVWLQSDAFNPIKLFVEPVLSSLNYLENRRKSYRNVFMAGLSGGGWTTTLYAAIDQRISASFPVAGSLPESIRSFTDDDISDWEQSAANIYTIANYLDLYLLGTYRNRSQQQLLNVQDPCCFRGKAARLYEQQVNTAARQWGGSFSVSFDEKTVQHEVSAQHMDTIIRSIEKITGTSFPAAAQAQNPCVQPTGKIEMLPPFKNEIGHAYVAALPALEGTADNMSNPARSKLIICEDGTQLGPNHSPHDMVRQKGAGAFSHWNSYVLFSSSNNSDPNANSRHYWAITPAR